MSETIQKKIWVAKEVSQESVSLSKSVPMSIFKKAMGISEAKKVSKHSILGEWDDYEEFEKYYQPQEQEEKVTANEPAEKDTKAEVKPEKKIHLQQVERKKKSDKETQWSDRVNLFQKYREIREEHALLNWRRHSLDWHQTEIAVAKKTGKAPEDLLMARLGEYRKIVENRQLIEEALLLLEQQNINFWKEGLKIGNDLLGLSFQMPKGGPRQIERLHFNEKKPKKDQLWIENEDRKKDFSLVLKSIDPFYKHKGEYLVAIGKSLQTIEDELAQAYLKRLENLNKKIPDDSVPLDESIEKSSSTKIAGLDLQPGLHLLSSAKRLFFEVPLNQISNSVVTIHNRGTVATFFEWYRDDKANPNPLKLSGAKDRIQRFFFSYTKGVILPGTAFDFPIVFKSTKNGIFTETWSLVTSPELPQESKISITLQGVANENDIYVQKRANIDKLLHSRRAKHIAKEVMAEVLNRVMLSKPKYTLPNQDTHKKEFEERNRTLKLYYNPVVYSKINKLAISVYESLQEVRVWNSSVLSLYDSIMKVSSAETQSAFISALNQLVKESTVDSDTSHLMMNVICNETLVFLSGKIVDISEDLRKKFNLPPRTQVFNDVDTGAEDAEAEAIKAALDAKKGAIDPKKGGAAAKQPNKAAAPPAKQADAGKKPGGKKPAEQEEELNVVPKQVKKKVPASNGWSPERKQLEAKYSGMLFEMARSVVVNSVDKMVTYFDKT